MKHLNTALVLLALGAVALNFYFDHRNIAVLKQELEACRAATAAPAPAEPGPFDKPAVEQNISSNEVPVGPQTTITFAKKTFDFGNITEGSVYKTAFLFTNIGSNDLLVSDAIGSCGCTVPTWPEEAIKPGQSAEIKVEFDAKGRDGTQLKTVTVTSNTTPSKTVLTIRSNVQPQK